MRKAIVLAVLALALPSVALANPPSTHTHHLRFGKSHPIVTYVVKGTFTSFAAATATTDGSISIVVRHSNFHARALHGQTLTFTVTPTTRITFRHGTTATQLATTGARGIVKFRAPLRMKVPAGTSPTTALTTMARGLHVLVLGPAPAPSA
jgi:hypothetical protein